MWTINVKEEIKKVWPITGKLLLFLLFVYLFDNYTTWTSIWGTLTAYIAYRLVRLVLVAIMNWNEVKLFVAGSDSKISHLANVLLGKEEPTNWIKKQNEKEQQKHE